MREPYTGSQIADTRNRMKKISMFLLMIAISSPTFSGFHGLTHHSRANCANNETISWHLGHNYWFFVVSRHRKGREDHQVVQDWTLTWRGAAVHWGEGRGGWSVEGQHWMKDNYGRPVEVINEFITDCSIYDGWWDQ
jgi:hypothetical protein